MTILHNQTIDFGIQLPAKESEDQRPATDNKELDTRPDSSLRYRRYINHLLTYTVGHRARVYSHGLTSISVAVGHVMAVNDGHGQVGYVTTRI